MSLPQFANELIHQILGNLQCTELFLCSQVSRSFFGIASALRFRSITVRCDLEDEYSSGELPSKAKTEHAHLEAIETDVSLGKFVKQLRFDMAYCLHALDMYEHSVRMGRGVTVIDHLVKSAWAMLQHLSNVEDLIIRLYNFDNKEFTADLFQYAKVHFSFWQKLRHLQIENSSYGSSYGLPNGRVEVGGSRLKVWRFVALATNLRSLSLGDVDVELLADKLPHPAKLSHLKQLDISLTRAPEFVLHAISSKLMRWISLYRYQLTSLTLRLLDVEDEMDSEIIAAQLENLDHRDVVVLPHLSHLKLGPIFRPDLLASTLVTLAPKLAHLQITINYDTTHYSPATSLLLSALTTIGIASSCATLLPLYNCFASIAPNLKYLQAYSERYTDDRVVGAGEHCWYAAASSTDLPIESKVMRLSLRLEQHFSGTLLDRLLSSYAGPVDLHLQFLGYDHNTRISSDCEGCAVLLGSAYSMVKENEIRQRLVRQCEALMEDCDKAFASLQAADLFGCCIEVVGNGEPELDCHQCTILEETGAMHAVREVCAYRGKKKGVRVIGETSR